MRRSVENMVNIVINSPTKFFIESVDYTGSESINECTLNCVIPEVYNWQTPKNFFE
jgi:hypothetical protein